MTLICASNFDPHLHDQSNAVNVLSGFAVAFVSRLVRTHANHSLKGKHLYFDFFHVPFFTLRKIVRRVSGCLSIYFIFNLPFFGLFYFI